MSTEITVKLVEHGERVVRVDQDDFAAARAAGDLDYLLDAEASRISATVLVIGPDGYAHNLNGPAAEPRPSLIAPIDVPRSEALAAVLRATTPVGWCTACVKSGVACPFHQAEAILRAVRQEDLILVTRELADQILAQAVATALSTAADQIERDGGTVLTATWAADVLRAKAAEHRAAAAGDTTPTDRSNG